ncbi:FAD-dependent thymidylate synthase [Candidatus Caldatribacterium sp.]|uniref:FAD-dependent thymidylate synthase n=1 Tax=Candidatus Caldatribacterium sp. TaxID=2282143 RepID=UPI00383DDDCD|nr:FAD-dependent thymidylate synthase [Candidatus Caldatribacterium sp.]
MKVDLIHYTNDPYSVVYFAGKSCVYGGRELSWDQVAATPLEEKEQFIRKLIAQGHESVLEHVTFTFRIYDVSRVLTHQLVRHRIASYSQLSHRRLVKEPSFVVPDGILNLPDEKQKVVKRFFMTAVQLYNSLIREGVPEDEARYVLPQGITTTIVATFNARSLRNFLRLRLAKDASFEIRELAATIFDLVAPIAPVLVEDLRSLRYEQGGVRDAQ